MADTKKRTALKDLSKSELEAKMRKLEAAYFMKDIEAALSKSNLKGVFEGAMASLKDTKVTAIQLLEALGKEVEIPRLVVTQSPRKKRAGKAANPSAKSTKK